MLGKLLCLSVTMLALGPCVARQLPPPNPPVEQHLNGLPEAATPNQVIPALMREADEAEKACKWDEALRVYGQALTKARSVGDRDGEATVLARMGRVHDSTGQPEKALEYYDQALGIARVAGNREIEADALDDIGMLYAVNGQPQKALDCLQQCLAIHKEMKNKNGEATALNGIGWVYNYVGDLKKALDYYQQSAAMHKEVGDKRGEAIALGNVGSAYYYTNQPRKALAATQQALALLRAVGDKLGESSLLNNLGTAYCALGELHKGQEYYRQALRVSRTLGDKEGEAAVLDNMSGTYDDLGRLTEASACASQAVTLMEDMRQALGVLTEVKIGFLQRQIDTYRRCIYLLLRQNQTPEAFYWTEKTKARALIDLMLSGNANFSQSLTEEERGQEQVLRRRVEELNQQIIAAGVGPDPDRRQLGALKSGLAKAERDLQIFTDGLYVKHPRLAAKRGAKTARLQDVARLLPADTALLEYFALSGPNLKTPTDKWALFCVTVRNGKPEVRAYLITQTRKQMSERVTDFVTACANPSRAYEQKARDLYQLLVAPAEKQLAGKTRLLICPDEMLWELPFQALIIPSAVPETAMTKGKTPTAPPPSGDGKFLLERYEIAYAYSATGAQAAMLAGEDANRPKPAEAVMVMANPDFGTWTAGTGDERIRPIPADARPIAADARSVYLAWAGGIKSLPGTQQEADAIKRLFPEALVLTGKEAQEATVVKEAARYRYLHFASHGFLNDAVPLMSGVVLAEPQPGLQGDGFLSARDICDMKLSAEMVVLSACETARGEKPSGEGVVGLTWALFVAGSPTQVVSQWQVSDESTAELMMAFYKHLKAGTPKGKSLCAAALALRKDERYKHPYYWAPFILMGDWR